MLIPESYGQVNLIFSGQAVPTGAQVTIGIGLVDSTESLTDAAAVVSGAISAANFESIIENDSQLDGFLLKLGPNDDGPSGFFSHVTVGDAGSEGTAPNVAALVKKITNVGGRQGRGRLYWPFVMQSWIDDGGNIGGAETGTITNCWTDFADGLSAAGYSAVLLHAESSPSKPPHQIEGFLCDGLAATQRRRLRR